MILFISKILRIMILCLRFVTAAIVTQNLPNSCRRCVQGAISNTVVTPGIIMYTLSAVPVWFKRAVTTVAAAVRVYPRTQVQ
jgi:hypothetical protein